MSETSVRTTNSTSAQPIPWVMIGWFTGLLTLLFLPVLKTMVLEWSTDESMGHGFFVPPVAAYIAWQRRDRILALPAQGHWLGWLMVAWSFCQLLAGFLGADFFVMRTGFLIAMVGLLLATCGWAIMKELAFPLMLLVFMIRIPLFIYSQITFPLQLFASSMAANILSLVGIPVFQDGNVLELANHKLSVVEACSGIRSLLSLSFLSLVYAYFFDERLVMRWILLVASIPIAIIANASRVSLTGIISVLRPEWAEGFYHSLEGWILFMVALGGLLATHKLIAAVWSLAERRRGTHV